MRIRLHHVWTVLMLAAFHAADAVRRYAGAAGFHFAWRRPEAERPEQPDESRMPDVLSATTISAAAAGGLTVNVEPLALRMVIPDPVVTLG